MNEVKNICDFVIIILKCVFIIMFFGIILPYIIDLIIKNFLIENNHCNDSILVFNMLNTNKLILYKFTCVVRNFFML